MPAGGAAGARKPGVRLSETLVVFALAGRASTETGVAFAGEKWVFFVCFSVAEVLSVSMVVVQGQAVAMAVSCWPASPVAEVSLVSTSPCRCVLCANSFAPRALIVGVSAKKFARPLIVDPKPHTATHSDTQRMQKRPGPRPRALPATHELR